METRNKKTWKEFKFRIEFQNNFFFLVFDVCFARLFFRFVLIEIRIYSFHSFQNEMNVKKMQSHEQTNDTIKRQQH